MKESLLQGKIGLIFRCRVAVGRRDSKCIHLFPEWILGESDAFHALNEELRKPVAIKGVDAQSAWGNDIPLIVDVEVKGAAHTALFRNPITMEYKEEIVYDASAICITPIPCEFSISGRMVEQWGKPWCDTFYWRDPLMKEWEFPRHDSEGKLLPFPLLFLRCRQGESMSFCGPYHYTAHDEYVCMSPFLSGMGDACLTVCASEDKVKQAGLYALGKADVKPQGVKNFALTKQFQVIDEEKRDILTYSVQNRDAATLEQLFIKFPNINPNVQDQNGQTLLMRACRAGSWDIVHCLLKHRANPHLLDDNGQTLIDVVQQIPNRKTAVELLEKFGIHVPILKTTNNAPSVITAWKEEEPIQIVRKHPVGHEHGLPYRVYRGSVGRRRVDLRCYDSLKGYRFTTNPPDGYNLNTSETERTHVGRKLGRCACDIPKWKLDAFNLNFSNSYWFIDTQIDGVRRTWRCAIGDLIRYGGDALHGNKYSLYFDFKRGLAYTTPIIGVELAIPFERVETE